MKILHIFKNTNEKFFEPYIEFINYNFDVKEHVFMIQGTDKRIKKISRENVKFIKGVRYIQLVKELYKVDKIILHSLMSPTMILILFLQPWILKKCYWVIWGGDLYYYKYRKRNFKTKIYEMMRRAVIKNMGGIITHIKGDYQLSQKWYGVKGKYYYCFMYPSNLYKEHDISTIEKNNETIYIQIGNSSDPSNNHLEVLQKLEKYKDEKIKIICPLSYGNIEYRDKVLKEGAKIFGDKFEPLLDFMPFEEYLKLLAKIDMAIFNHKRQQAMGNITTLLGLGKKVYIRNDITTWDFCREHGLKVYNSNNNFEDLFDDMDEVIKEKNIKNVKEKFSEEKLKQDMLKIYKE
ncbi:MAG: TDP-N-acetylfucosamine:lipid II N-acetylfucosaminyltransferase [Clostridiaceae bacterium]|nr:TDP-N-acetylfucosamine:lipid II N-acetylfucosaminyltransferase [Clostridiaceae bacterium]MBW4860682.1 TDP-N-acetylfucosamine:lipid II N-acetylfucosaminyltransferase [Clostridiaceae bacterium]MBW4867736.1 TDP-N-acetylfucosamine:lipid II N-acetylfucosaminyltransferase [Clostridiaceae bacterium]